MKGGGAQGYLIDKKSADKFGIKSVMDIKKHAKEFDSNGCLLYTSDAADD